MQPVTVTVDVPEPRDEVWAFLDVLANHECFNDHFMREWRFSGPPAGVGATVNVTGVLAGRRDPAEVVVVEADAPRRSVERNVSANGKRVAHGTYELAELPAGGTRVTFTYAWERAPLSDRLGGPLTRMVLRRVLGRSMTRLREELAARS
jgi:carbon monoxide dehydrogenase subunit G